MFVTDIYAGACAEKRVRPQVPPLGSAAAWNDFHPNEKQRWWHRAMARMVEMSNDELSICDIGELNLICAYGLPGAGELQITSHLEKLDHWAELVREETSRKMWRFEHDSTEFRESEAYFRMVVFVTLLQRDLGVAYDPDSREGTYTARDASPWFIHGLLRGLGGSCVSMPILYLAIGRRLGYPLRLVHTMEHSYVRWDDPEGERLNIEATSQGLQSYPDSYYMKWPRRLTQHHLSSGAFFRCVTPREELGFILGQRGSCLRDNRNFAAALECYYWAQQLDSVSPVHAARRAVTTILLHQSSATHNYGLDESLPRTKVEESGCLRDFEEWEQWAVPIAKREWQRLKIIHGELPEEETDSPNTGRKKKPRASKKRRQRRKPK